MDNETSTIISNTLIGSSNALYTKLNYGRKRISLDYDEVTPDNVVDVLKKAIKIHNVNKTDCDYLIKYFLGEQDILRRPTNEANNINNKTVINYAYPIIREIVGYTFGSAVQLVQKDLSKQEDVRTLADIYAYENDYYVDICTAIYLAICGIAYQITLPSADISKDDTPEIPIRYDYLDPRETFVVQGKGVGRPQIMSCHIITNDDNSKTFEVYTNQYKMTITSKTNSLKDDTTIVVEENPIGLNPITMFENSLFLTGDFEQVLPVLNAINQVGSDTLNDIEMIIKSLLVIIGAEFDENDDNATLNKVKQNKILTLTNTAGGNVDAKFIAPTLDAIGLENIRTYLNDAKNIITGIPDRKSQGTGGDTGAAVINRDGWTDIEIVARLKEMFFKKGKKKQISVAIRILQQLDLISKELSVVDIEPVIGRHTTDNLLVKTQALSTLVATGILADIDSLELSGLTNKNRELIERGKQSREEKIASGEIVLETNEPTTPTNSNDAK